MQLLKAANLAIRFILELCLLGALGFTSFQLGQGLVVKIILAIAAPLIAAIVWGRFIAPRASIALPYHLWLGIQALLFGAAVAGLIITGHSTLAGVFAVCVVINLALLAAWEKKAI